MSTAVVDRVRTIPTGDSLSLPLEYGARRRSSDVDKTSSPALGEKRKKDLSGEETTLAKGKEREGSFSCSTLPLPQKNQSLLVPATAVLSSNYNYTVLAAAMVFMEEEEKYKEATHTAYMSATLKMLCYAGAVIGQFGMGYVGDVFGRRIGMVITLFLVVIGSFCSSLCTWGTPITVLSLMCLWRFVLGIGNGGTYPLSAVAASEGTASDKAEDRSPRVSFAYMMNVPGIILPYLLGFILCYVSTNPEVSWRLLIGLGCLPALLVFSNAFKLKDSEEFEKVKYTKKLWLAIKNPENWAKLAGTGISWFLYDVAAYGILLVQPDIQKQIFGQATTTSDIMWQGIVLNSIGIPAIISGILVVRPMGIKWLQFWGFFFLALSAFGMAIVALAGGGPTLLMIALCIVNFFINWGVSISTFILPSVAFPPECRSTYNGVSAAMGKVGAVVGIYSLKVALTTSGLPLTLSLAGFASFLGCFSTWFYVNPTSNSFLTNFYQAWQALLVSIPFVDLRRSPSK